MLTTHRRTPLTLTAVLSEKCKFCVDGHILYTGAVCASPLLVCRITAPDLLYDYFITECDATIF
jgi:hypothetical protein